MAIELFLSPGTMGGTVNGTILDDDDEDEDDDEEICELLQLMIGRAYTDFQDPIDMHVRTDGENIVVVICRNDPAEVHFYFINAKEYAEDKEDEDNDDEYCLRNNIVNGMINQPFEAEMLSRAFLEHILLNPERQKDVQPERTEA